MWGFPLKSLGWGTPDEKGVLIVGRLPVVVFRLKAGLIGFFPATAGQKGESSPHL
jgi:hypothetical protein